MSEAADASVSPSDSVLAQLYPTMALPSRPEAQAAIDPALRALYPSMVPVEVRLPVTAPSATADVPDAALVAMYPSMFDEPAGAGPVAPGADPAATPPSAAASPPAPEIQAAMGEYAVKFPEGWQPNPEELTSARDLFRSLELNPRQGGALLAHYVRLQERHAAADSDRIDQWERQIAADAELGGNRLSLTTANARAAVERFGDTKLKEVLEQTGLGSHPELVRFVVRIAGALEAAKSDAAYWKDLARRR